MLVATTHFNKADLPDVSKADLIDIYYRFFQTEEMDNLWRDESSIVYRDSSILRPLNSNRTPNLGAPFFSKFAKAELFITEDEQQFVAYFYSNFSSLIKAVAVVALLPTVVLLFLPLPWTDAIGFGLLICLVTGLGNWLLLKGRAVSNFDGLRNDIVREVRKNGKYTTIARAR